MLAPAGFSHVPQNLPAYNNELQGNSDSIGFHIALQTLILTSDTPRLSVSMCFSQNLDFCLFSSDCG